MRKTLATIAVAALVLFASSAMAAGAKVPKLLCIEYNLYGVSNQLSFKASGTIMAGTAKVKTYAITGSDLWGPVTGSAYVIPSTTTLRAVYFSTNTVNYDQQSATYKLLFNLETGTGTIDIFWVQTDEPAVAPFKQIDTVYSMDCDLALGPAGTDDNKATGPALGKP